MVEIRECGGIPAAGGRETDARHGGRELQLLNVAPVDFNRRSRHILDPTRRSTLQRFNPPDTSAEIHDENLRILSCRNNSSIVTLGTQHPAGMPPGEIQQLSARLHVEDLDVRVVGARHEPARHAVDVEGSDQTLVGLHFPETFSRVGVPDANDLVVASTRDETPVLGELAAGEALGVTLELANLLARLNVPQLDPEVPAAAHNGVATHLDRVHGPAVPT